MNDLSRIINSNKKIKQTRNEFFIHGNTLMLINGKLPDGVNAEEVKKRIEKNVPRKLFKDLDWIYIGEFPELNNREVGSAYLRGAIYITNDNQSEDSIYASIIHELAHSVETNFKEYLYGDNEIIHEFTIKRKKLKDILGSNNYNFHDPSFYIRPEYNPDFDQFLYKEVGYDILNQLCVGLFVSPYAATSLREYFANGFEHYYLGDIEYLKKTSPKLFFKISKLTKKAE